MSVLSKNLKRFRLAKNLTQERSAEALGVSTQAVSRWECGTTLPDVTILPKIAALYCVTIDDLYRETSVAYDNYAQRLCSVFEASQRPEDFMQANLEFQRLFQSGQYTMDDLRQYGILHQYMMQVCRDRALRIFDHVIAKGPEADRETYWSVRRQRSYLLWEHGQNQKNIDTFLPLVEAGSRELQEWICLIQAYTFEEDYLTAWNWIEKAKEVFTDSAILHIYAGDVLRGLKRYDEAFYHWDRALEMEPQWCDSAYAKASCYEELGDYENAASTYEKIVLDLTNRGFASEVEYPRKQAQRCREKIK